MLFVSLARAKQLGKTLPFQPSRPLFCEQPEGRVWRSKVPFQLSRPFVRSTGLEIQEITVEKQRGLHLQRSEGLDIQTDPEV